MICRDITAKVIEEESMNQLVSIIVPVYGVEQYLDKSVECLVSQTYKNIEIILVDDGSKDMSGILCDHWKSKDTRIKVVHQDNQGLAGARNTGISMSTGEFVLFVDSDDYVEKDFVELLLRACIENHCQIAISNYNIVDSDTLRVVASGEQRGISYVWTPMETLMHREFDPQFFIGTIVWNKMFARTVIECMHFPVGKLYEDTVYTYDAITKAEKIAYIDKPLYNYRANRAGSILNSGIKYDRIDQDLYPLLNERSRLLRGRGYDKIADRSDYKACESLITYIEISNSMKCYDQLDMLKKWMEVFYPRCRHSIGLFNKVKMYHICPATVYAYDYFVERLKSIYHKIWR